MLKPTGVRLLRRRHRMVAGVEALEPRQLLSASSSALTVSAAVPAALSFVQNPTNVVAGKAIGPAVTVKAVDAFGNLVPNASITLAVLSGPGALFGTVTAKTSTSGIGTFGNLMLHAAGSYRLIAADGAIKSAMSNAVTVSAAAATSLAFTTLPSGVKPATAFTVKVSVEDAYGNVLTADKSGTITLALNAHPTGAILGGTLTVGVAAGVAAFSTLTVNLAGTYSFKASDNFGIATATSSSIAVTSGPPTIVVTSLVDALSLAGHTTLRGALLTANAASVTDTIEFAPSLFASGPATLKMAGTEFPITRSVNIVGPGQSKLTIDAQQLSRVFDISSSSAKVALSQLTVTHGIANGSTALGGSGGAIYNTGSLTLTNVTVANSTSQTIYINTDTTTYGGGGIYNHRGSLTLNTCLVENNTTAELINGGGILSTGGTMNIQNSTFSKNEAGGIGAAISGNDGCNLTINNTTADTSINMRYFGSDPRASTLVMTNCHVGPLAVYGTSTITNSTTGALNAYESVTISNSTLGAVMTSSYVKNGNLNITRSTLAQLDQEYGNATITDSTFTPSATGTYAITVGAGQGTTFLENDTISGYSNADTGTIYFPVGGNATVRNCTIARNHAMRGGGIVVGSGDLKMDSTIVADNTASTISNDLAGYVTGQNNLIGDPTGAFLLSANNLTGVNPDLGSLANNGGPTQTMALLPGSPAINAGSNLDHLLYDQRGLARVSGSGPDIGAYEVQMK